MTYLNKFLLKTNLIFLTFRRQMTFNPSHFLLSRQSGEKSPIDRPTIILDDD